MAEGHQTSSPVFGVSKAVLDIRILPPLCPDQGCIDTGVKEQFSYIFKVSFTLFVTRAAHSQAALIQLCFVQAGAQELPKKVLPVLVCSSPGHREKGSPMEVPAHRPYLLLLQFRAQTFKLFAQL